MSIVDSHLEQDFTRSPRYSAITKCILYDQLKGYFLNPGPNITAKRINPNSTGEVDFPPSIVLDMFAVDSQRPTYSDIRNWSRGRVKPPTCQEIMSWVSDYVCIAGESFSDSYTKAESLLTQKFSVFREVKAIYTGRYLSELVIHIHLSAESFEKSLMFSLFKVESNIRRVLEEIPLSFHYFPQKLAESKDIIPRSFKLIYEC